MAANTNNVSDVNNSMALWLVIAVMVIAIAAYGTFLLRGTRESVANINNVPGAPVANLNAASTNANNSVDSNADNNISIDTSLDNSNINSSVASTDNADSSTSPIDTNNTAYVNNWDEENNYWRNKYASSPYYNGSIDYSTYEPAYHYGFDLYKQNKGSAYSSLNQDEIKNGWEQINSNLSWDEAKKAVQDAYNRLEGNHDANNAIQ